MVKNIQSTILLSVSLITNMVDAEAAVNFHYGDACAKLQDIDEFTFESLLENATFEDLDKFCTPAQPLECEDYSLYVEPFGELATIADQLSCRFLNWREEEDAGYELL
jgi:hypothetical protein